MTLSISSPEKEGVFQGSKWIKLQILCDASELKLLFDAFEPCHLFHLTGIGNGQEMDKEKFLEAWQEVIEKLKRGVLEEDLKPLFAAALTKDLNALWLQKIEGKGFLVKLKKPVLQLQAHYFTYSKEDAVFRPMSMGPEAIFWGIQFSWPTLCQDPKTMEFYDASKAPELDILRKWSRDVSRPAPFMIDEKKEFSTIRLGKNCFSWINNHPQLNVKRLYISG